MILSLNPNVCGCTCHHHRLWENIPIFNKSVYEKKKFAPHIELDMLFEEIQQMTSSYSVLSRGEVKYML